MENDLRQVLDEVLNENLGSVILSNSRDTAVATKARIRPVLIGGSVRFQETRFQGTKVFHENFSKEAMLARIEEELQTLYRQCEVTGRDYDVTVLVSRKGKMTVKKRRHQNVPVKGQTGVQPQLSQSLSHNRTKRYLLPEGEPVDFLVGLGVQTPDGRITKNRYDKFRQINRYLEFIEDVLEELPADRELHIVDFGCGKSYLTFAMYYYLHVKEKREIKVVGLDLKEDVIRHCNELAESLHYEKLHFERGDIQSYQGGEEIDMVVSLHACDLATDYALEKAVKWGAKVILAVPCCQHELNRQMKNDMLEPVLQYGIIRERMSALITDAVRAQVLEEHGYETQILEFIDMEHTPKNLLIRGVKRNKMRARTGGEALHRMEAFLQIDPALERLLAGRQDGGEGQVCQASKITTDGTE